MSTALFEQLTPCGRVIDAKASERVRTILEKTALEGGWIQPLDRAWAALDPIFAASPYLASLARKTPDRLGAILTQDPSQRLLGLLDDALNAGGEAGLAEGKSQLRRLKSELHLLTAVCDLGGVWDLAAVTGALTRFADVSLQSGLRLAVNRQIDAGRMRAPTKGDDGPAPGLFCLALGKQGAFELNYSSDIDVTIFYDPSVLLCVEGSEPRLLAQRLIQELVEILQERTADGYVFRVDLRLRPDPSSTPAAVPVDAALDYYESVGQNWERAAMIKARVAAGDILRGEAFLKALQPFIWRRNLDYAAIADIHSIKRQIHVHKVDERLTAPGANLKLGAGGIREIEFFVQTQQLIYGGRDPALRERATLAALQALTLAKLVRPWVERQLREHYERLRGLEHRIQMLNDEQTHSLPELAADRRRVAALAGFADLKTFDASVSRMLKEVNARYGDLFAEDEPLSSGFGSLVFTGVDDDPETLRTLGRMGFSQPAQVSKLIRAWHHGRIPATRTERGRELFTQLAPRLLEAARSTGAPDTAFNRFADFFVALSSGVQIQSLFLAEPKLFALVVEVMAFAPRLASTLARQPAALDALLDRRFFGPLDDGEAEGALMRAVQEAADFEAAMDAARRIHREQAFRIGVQVISSTANAEAAGRAFASLADVSISALTAAALDETIRIGGAFAGDVAIVALGKAGSREMNAASDLDLMSLYSPGPPHEVSGVKGWGAETFYTRFTQRLVAAMSAPTAEGGLYEVDLQLRPSGTAGPVAVSLKAFETYYASDAETWEFLALTRARVVWASSPKFAALAQDAIETALRRPRERRTTLADVRDMRELMRRERQAFGPWDLKLSAGGLVDIEFVAQAMQILDAPEGGQLHVNTDAALEAFGGAHERFRPQIATLRAAWRLQQTLSQVIKLALSDGGDPGQEPLRFQAILAKAAGARNFKALVGELLATQSAAHTAYETLLAA